MPEIRSSPIGGDGVIPPNQTFPPLVLTATPSSPLDRFFSDVEEEEEEEEEYYENNDEDDDDDNIGSMRYEIHMDLAEEPRGNEMPEDEEPLLEGVPAFDNDNPTCIICLGTNLTWRSAIVPHRGVSICQDCSERLDRHRGVVIDQCHMCGGIGTGMNNLSVRIQRVAGNREEFVASHSNFCQRCIADFFVRCASCRYYVHINPPPELSPPFRTSNGHIFCFSCSEEHESIQYVMPYNYVPEDPIFLCGTGSTEEPLDDMAYFGFELELEFNGKKGKAMKILSEEKIRQWSYVKHDGSIQEGVELVSHPMTWNFWRKNKADFKDVVDRVRQLGCASYDSGRCGFHVHLSRSAFSKWHLRKFVEFYYHKGTRKLITDVAQRHSERYASMREDLDLVNHREKSSFLTCKSHGGVDSRENKYQAVNTCKPHTIEVRIFRGSLRWKTVLKNIEFVYASFEYSKKFPLSSMPDPQKFLEFVDANKNRFPNLFMFLNNTSARSAANQEVVE